MCWERSVGRGVKEKNMNKVMNNEAVKDGVVPSATVASGINKAGNGADVVGPLEYIRVVSERYANSTYGLFLEKRVAYPVVANNNRNTWGKYELVKSMLNSSIGCERNKRRCGNVSVCVTLHGVLVTAFSEYGLSANTTKLDTPLMLDSYTFDMCIQSWDKSSYTRALIEILADVEMKDTVMVAMPKLVGQKFYTCTIRVEVDVIDVTCEDFVQDVLDFQYNPKSTNPTLVFDDSISENDSCKVLIVKSSSLTLTPFGESDLILEEIEDFLNDDSILDEIDDSVFDPEGDIRLIEKWLNADPFNELEDLMRLVVLSPIEDRWMWGLENSGLFSVASIRRHIDDKMLSGFNISRRGIPIDSVLCVNCDMGVETSRHLFFSCCMAKEVTNLIARWWDVPESEIPTASDEFLLPEEVSTASEEKFPLLKKRDATAEKFALLMETREKQLLYRTHCPIKRVLRSLSREQQVVSELVAVDKFCRFKINCWIMAFYDYHNMIAILDKYEHNTDFHQIVDFVEASHLRIETTDEGTKILAIVDGISSLPDAELFENLTLMGYNILPNQKFSFQKGQFFHQWKYIIYTIMQCLSPKSIGFNEFSSNIATALVCLATNRVYNFSKMIFDGMVQNVNNKVSKFLMYPRFLSKCLKMGQFGQITHTHTYAVPFHIRKFFTTLRVNSPSFLGRTVPLFPSMLVTMGEGSGTPTESHYTPSPEAQQTSPTATSSQSLPPVTTATIPIAIPTDIPQLRQYTRRARIAQSSALPIAADEPASPIGDDSQGEACPTVSGLEAEQDRANITKTSTLPSDSTPRVTSLAADEGSMQHKLQELTDLYTHLQRQQDEMASKITTHDLEIATLKARIKHLEDRDGGDDDPSGEDATIKGGGCHCKYSPAGEIHPISVPTGSGVVPTASPIFTTATVATPNTRRKSKEKMVESETPKKKKLQEQIDMEMARKSNEMNAKHLHEYDQVAVELTIGANIELINELVKYQDHHKSILKYQAQQKQDSAKKVKTSEEVSEEDLKAMMQLVPVEEVYVEALQVKHPIIDWEIQTEGQRSYCKIIRLGGSTTSYQFFVDMLKHFDREDLNQLWALVKETLNIRQATSNKEKELWVELKRLYEPDVEDQLWTQTQALMHDLVECRLYDRCGVHHILSRDQEIFMLVEREYPLRKGLAIVIISNKLQVENYSQMASNLIQKIHKIANSIPTASDEFPLPEEVPTASEEKFPLLKKRDATVEKFVMLMETRVSRGQRHIYNIKRRVTVTQLS
uniref:Reverse transcriptase zinc-binding domain-containing protein n=1 Tax=Tanacetum cinerariifolium TaxID=118510 RepID=A0A6L2JWM9_TANCI|nr:hypothetical protein [Tanacetum cinerariifolium]